MYKKTTALLLILLLNFQIFSQMGIFGWFVLNNDTIARTLCENKNRPQLHCNGQCYLAKKLKAAQQEDRQKMADLLKVREIKLFCSTIFNFGFVPTAVATSRQVLPFYQPGSSDLFATGIFQPPRL